MSSPNPKIEFKKPVADGGMVVATFSILVIFFGAIAKVLFEKFVNVPTLVALFSLSVFGFASCIMLIPGIALLCGENSLYGKDINKVKLFYM